MQPCGTASPPIPRNAPRRKSILLPASACRNCSAPAGVIRVPNSRTEPMPGSPFRCTTAWSLIGTYSTLSNCSFFKPARCRRPWSVIFARLIVSIGRSSTLRHGPASRRSPAARPGSVRRRRGATAAAPGPSPGLATCPRVPPSAVRLTDHRVRNPPGDSTAPSRFSSSSARSRRTCSSRPRAAPARRATAVPCGSATFSTPAAPPPPWPDRCSTPTPAGSASRGRSPPGCWPPAPRPPDR